MTDVVPAQAHTPPKIAVVVASRDNQAGAANAVASILRSAFPVELCVVDQSEGAIGPELRTLAADARLQVVKVPPEGLAAARNVGVRRTGAPLIAFTDDDCQVDPGWLEGIVAAFDRDPRIGIVFGSVRAASYDRSLGFIQAYEVEEPHVARSLERRSTICGIGACMAVRRSVFEVIHGFDEHLGAGTFFCSAEDCDIVVRCLLAGFWVCETPDAVVTHFGFRPWQEGRGVIRGYMLGLGAVQAKMLRLGGRAALKPTFALAWRWLFRSPIVDLNHRPPRLMRLRAFLRGAWLGWRLPVDRVTGCFE